MIKNFNDFEDFKKEIVRIIQSKKFIDKDVTLWVEHYIKVVASFEDSSESDKCAEFINTEYEKLKEVPINFTFIKQMIGEAQRKSDLINTGFFQMMGCVVTKYNGGE